MAYIAKSLYLIVRHTQFFTRTIQINSFTMKDCSRYKVKMPRFTRISCYCILQSFRLIVHASKVMGDAPFRTSFGNTEIQSLTCMLVSLIFFYSSFINKYSSLYHSPIEINIEYKNRIMYIIIAIVTIIIIIKTFWQGYHFSYKICYQ